MSRTVMKNYLAIFEYFKIRRLYDETSETWYYSVVDIIQALTQQRDFQAARKYWKKLKGRLGKEGSLLDVVLQDDVETAFTKDKGELPGIKRNG